MFRRFLLTAAVAVAVALVAPATSRADVVVTLTVGADTVTIDANSSGFITITDANLGNISPITFQGGTNATESNLPFQGSLNNGNGATTYISWVNDNNTSDFVTGTVGGIIQSLTITGLTFDGYTFDVNTISSNAPGTPSSATLNLVINTLQVAPSAYSSSNTSGFQSNVNGPSLFVSAAQGNGAIMGVVPNGGTTSNDSYMNPLGNVYMTNFGQFSTNTSLPNGVTMTTGGSYVNGTTVPISSAISLSSSNPGGSTYNGGNITAPFSSTTGFEVTSSITLNGITAGSSFGSGDTEGTDSLESQITIRPTPAPTSLILAATMVPFFGLLRRKLRKLANAEATVVA